MRDHTGDTIGSFNGLWARGKSIDTCPRDHFTDGLNFECLEQGVKSRWGFDTLVTTSSVMRMYVYKLYGQADRILFLDNNGSIWDSTNLVSPILTINGMLDFAFENINGFAYISPSDGFVGMAGQSLYVYIGSGTARLAAGVAPVGSALVAANSATSGNYAAGLHIFSVAYETNTGFITPPGPAVFAQLVSTGGLSVDLSNIPTGGSDIVARRILSTQLVTNYNGDQQGYEFFFVPNGRIPDNTSTTFTISAFDADLFTSADYLFDLFPLIPAGNHISVYSNRLCMGGENANPSVERISQAGQPEAINQASGLLQIDSANASSAVTNCQAYRGILYIAKRNRFYAANDNGGDPATWQVLPLDQGHGADLHTIATVLDTGGVNIDIVLVGNVSGLWIFNGTLNFPALSWKIDDIWKRINKKYFHLVHIVLDTTASRVYCTIPLDSAIAPSHILVMDYETSPSMDYTLVRWLLWTLPVVPTTVAVETVTSTQIPQLLVGSSAGNIYNQDLTALNDFGNLIPTPFIQTALMPCPIANALSGLTENSDGTILHFGSVRLRVYGSGTLYGTMYSYDGATSDVLAPYTLSSVPGVEKNLISFMTGERSYLNLSLNNVNDWFKINKIRFFTNKLWEEVPG
jgi:hypothetical protein